eukprot:jgi/Chlat1/6310/Chrsp44S05884
MDSSVKLSFFCFLRVDAETLLSEMKAKDPSLGRIARVEPDSSDKLWQAAGKQEEGLRSSTFCPKHQSTCTAYLFCRRILRSHWRQHCKTPRRKGVTAPAHDIEVEVFENVLNIVESDLESQQHWAGYQDRAKDYFQGWVRPAGRRPMLNMSLEAPLSSREPTEAASLPPPRYMKETEPPPPLMSDALAVINCCICCCWSVVGRLGGYVDSSVPDTPAASI